VTLEAGQQLLHDRLTEKIGEGGMGVVWPARDQSLARGLIYESDTTILRQALSDGLPELIAVDVDRFLFQLTVEAQPPQTIRVIVGWDRLLER
jgi:hypothetical protein